ncbi:MAG: sulfatase/phosphatase domain-containing protein [Planctomycetota bacterium]
MSTMKENNMFDDGPMVRSRIFITARYKLVLVARREACALYDLQEDPHELHNLWHDAHARALRDEVVLDCAREGIWTECPGVGRTGGA